MGAGGSMIADFKEYVLALSEQIFDHIFHP